MATISATFLHFVCSEAGLREEKSPAVLLPLTSNTGALIGFACTVLDRRCGKWERRRLIALTLVTSALDRRNHRPRV